MSDRAPRRGAGRQSQRSAASSQGSRVPAPAAPPPPAREPRVRSLRQGLVEDSDDSDWEQVPPPVETPQQREDRVVSQWARVCQRARYLRQNEVQRTVTDRWARQAMTDPDRPAPRAPAAPEAPTAKARPRAQPLPDMVIVGHPIPSTSRPYPIPQVTCAQAQHQNVSGQTLLTATGHSGPGRIPVYTWTCLGCGARWIRLPAPPGHPLHNPENYQRQMQALRDRPPPRRSGPLRPQGVASAPPQPPQEVPLPVETAPAAAEAEAEDRLLPGPMSLG